MLKELNMNEMEEINGGVGSFVRDAVIGGIGYDILKATAKATVDKLAHTPYERTVTRGGKKYTVKYDGNPGW